MDLRCVTQFLIDNQKNKFLHLHQFTKTKDVLIKWTYARKVFIFQLITKTIFNKGFILNDSHEKK